MENKTKLRTLLYAGLILFLVFLARHCSQPNEFKFTSTWKPDPTIPAQYQLKPEEKAKVIVDTNNRRMTVVSPNKIQTYTGVRHATIIEKKDGTVEVVAKQYGFCFEPGVGVMVSDHVGVALDVQLGYWKDAGLNIGARLWPAPSPFVSLSYSLSGLHLTNTSVYAGADILRRYPCFGIRVRI